MSQKGSIDGKLAQALVFKDEGNTFYKEKDYKKALRKYHNAILYMKGIDNDLHGTPAFMQTSSSVDPNSQKKISPDLERECIKANISIYNNLAACLLAQAKDECLDTEKSEQNHLKVVQYTDIVLELDKNNDKAMFRKAQALKNIRDFSSARENFENLKRLYQKNGIPVGRDVIAAIQECTEALKESDKKEKSMYKNMFGS